ncbi:MAG TPA: xanthine dehydrogenase accessory protein XdhC [Ornithinimicrobium sp.]|nr:xanthine dehydrogenase accessory protein XdhC [Ornithinimicrobium sp.]
MRWLQAVEHLRSGRLPGVLVTLTSVRGHAPRAAGAKMVVGARQTWDTVGGGNLEAVAVERARAMLAQGRTLPETFTASLSERAPSRHGVQCCGGEVGVLLEPLPVTPVVAIFGMGHVGHELARILARQDLDLHLVDTRPEQLSAQMLAPLADADARVHAHPVPVLPELVLGELPAGTHVLVMTHDHAEDAAILDAALRTGGLGPVGLIGSSAKWARLRHRLLTVGGLGEEEVARVTTPIGLPQLRGGDPATIAVSVAADLLLRLVGPAPAVAVEAPAVVPGEAGEAGESGAATAGPP